MCACPCAGGPPAAGAPPVQPAPAKKGFFASLFGGDDEAPAPATSPFPTVAPKSRGGGRQPDSLATMVPKTAMRTATTAIVGTLGGEFMRGLLGGSRRR